MFKSLTNKNVPTTNVRVLLKGRDTTVFQSSNMSRENRSRSS